MADPTPWLDDEQAEAWLALVSILELLPAALDSQLARDADLTFFEFLVLTQLAEEPDRSLRLTDLAASTNTTLPRLSRVTARLEKDGFLARRVDERDGRSRRVSLTDAGWDKLAAVSPGHVELVQRLFVEQLTRDQLAQVRRIGNRLLRGLDPEAHVLAQSRGGASGRPGLSRAPAPTGD